VDISSTEIRNRIAENSDFTKMVHPAVADYIRKNGLYQSKDTADGQ
jgi:nicotinic acid mononucleotide adenylyltransferase